MPGCPITFNLPFSSGLNPHLDRARAHHRAWITASGLLPDAATAARYEAFDATRITGHCYPQASSEALELLTDWMGCLLLWDDEFDGPLGNDPAGAARFLDLCTEIFAAPPGAAPPTDNVYGRALADLSTRLGRRMSHAWYHRYARHMIDGCTGYLRQILDRHTGRVLDLEAQMLERRRDVLVEPLIDFVEVALGFELPASFHHTEEISAKRTSIVDASALLNDAFSLAKERPLNDMHNVILMMERLHGLDEARALAWVKDAVDNHVKAITDTGSLPGLYVTLGLSDQQRNQANQFLDGMGTLLIGQHNAQVDSARYHSSVRVQEHLQGIR